MPDAKRRPCARRPTRIAACLVLVASALAGETLRAGPPPATIKGKVTGWEKLVPAVYSESSKNDARSYTWREPSPTVKQEFRRLSANVARDVCVVAFDAAGNAPQAHEPLPVRVTGGRMTPSTIVLSPNSRLSFKNADPFAHELYEAGNDKWAPAATAPGSSREWAAGAPGLHEIRDQLFPSIVMYVVVDPAAVEFAFPDHDGAFSMSLPAGDYNFKVYFDGKPVGKDPTPVHVPDRGLLELREPMALGSDAK
jgi:hypothetical protein